MKKIFTLLFALLAVFTLSAQQITEEAKRRAAELVSKMTLEEKLQYIGGSKGFYIRAIPRLGIPEIRMADGPQGVRNNTKSTMFASGIAVAATWNRDAAYNMGVGLGQDCRARGVHILLGPGVNIYRSPLCGRNFEYFGEDPYLAAQTAVQYIKGVQSQGAMACIKHYAVNNQEWDRHHTSSDVDERTLHEIYLPAFRAAVEEAGVGSLMTAYNLINTVHASENKYLNIDVLRKMWGFEGILMSDWTSTYSSINVANGGLDLEMPSGRAMNYQRLAEAIENGVVDVRTIDTKVQHILQTLIAFGFFDRPQKDESISERNPFSDNAALELARNGVVMLKNDGILPLKSGKVTVTGIHSKSVPTGGGSGFVRPFETCSVLEGLQQEPSLKVVELDDIMTYSLEGRFYTDKDLKTPGLKAEFFNNEDLSGKAVWEYTSKQIKHKWKKSPKRDVINDEGYSVRWSGVYCSKCDEELEFKLSGDDGYRMFIDDEEVMADWRNHATTHRTYTFKSKANRKYNIRIEYFNNIREGIVSLEIVNNSFLAANAKSIKATDAVVVCVGFDASTEREGHDRTFELPYEQSKFIKDIAAINPNVVAVVNAGGGFEMESWLDSAKAVLLAWYPGQEGGQAIAEIISGKLSPSGHLPISIERKLEDNPTWGSYHYSSPKINVRKDPYKRVSYKEGIFLGYRGYDRSEVKPLFPFGFGLSYTSFKYSNLKVTPATEGYLVEFDVTNTGAMDGAEVAQVYVGYNDKSVPHPVKELKGYDKAMIKKGATHHFAITLPYKNLAYYDIFSHNWADASKDVTIYVGSSAEEIHFTQIVKH